MDGKHEKPAKAENAEAADLAVVTDLPAVPIVTDAEISSLEPFLVELVLELLYPEEG